MKEKLKKIFGAHPIAWSLLIIVVVAVVAALVWFFPAFGLKAAEVPVHQNTSAAIGEAIPVGGVYTVAQQEGRTLTLDTETLELVLTDDATGKKWSSFMDESSASATSTSATGTKGLLEVTFRGEDNKVKTWSTYENCVAFGTYKLYAIEDGVRIEMNVNEGDSLVYLEYLPERFPQERYEEFFLPAIDQLLEDGEITEAQHARYLDMLNQCYRKNAKGEPFYDKFFSGTSPAVTVRNALIELTGKIGYTREMLIEDCALNGVTPTFHEPPQFDIVVEFTLDGGDLVAHIPTDEIRTGNDFYIMQRIAVLPNLVAKAASAEDDGYYLTPDGSGALLRFNTFVGGKMINYERPYADNDYYADYYFQSEYAEELRMPVFGVINGVEPSTGGMLAIIEEGEETANLHITLGASSGTGSKKTYTGTNKAYVSVDTMEHATVKINGAYADGGPTFVANSGLIMMDFTVRYHPYTEEVTYYDMAMDYRAYLAGGETIEAPEGPRTYVEVVGAVTLIDRIAGIPYDNVTSMSTFQDAMAIVEALPEGSVVQYDGAFNGGIISRLNDGAEVVKENGTVEEMKALVDKAAEKGVELFFQANISRVYVNGRNYIPYLHALRDFGNDAAEIYPYTPDTAQFNGRWDPIRSYTRVSPKYLPTLAGDFVADLEAQGIDINIAAEDLGHDVFADFRYNAIIDQVEGNALVMQALDTLGSAGPLSLSDANVDAALKADYITDVSRTSSQYASFSATIPFRQLVLSGLTNVVGLDVNLNSRSLDYYLLQAAELGMGVKYTVTAQNPDVLKNSHFESLYAASWEQWKPTILEVAQKCEELRGLLGGQEIANHVILASEVFETTYSDGVRVITNYTPEDYESADGLVPANNARIIEPSGNTYLLLEKEGEDK